jgi:hypothetical protein
MEHLSRWLVALPFTLGFVVLVALVHHRAVFL